METIGTVCTLCRCRGGETLKKLIEESPHREVVEFSQLAFQRVLDKDLSAKYAFTGQPLLDKQLAHIRSTQEAVVLQI